MPISKSLRAKCGGEGGVGCGRLCIHFAALTDGTLTASLPAQVSVGDPEKAARARFVAQIEAGEIEWWTEINPYDRTPTVYDDPVFGSVTVDLFPDPPKGGDKGGTAGNPWPIYNVWHLQAIEGVSVSDENEVSGNFNSFRYGDSGGDRLRAHYYLAVDIDATTTRLWRGGGFRPIGLGSNFIGSIDGRGNAVRGLFISRSGDAGLIDTLGAGGTIKHLGVEEAEVRGNGSSAGILAALKRDTGGIIERVWTTGKVVGASNVGGLVGNDSGLMGRTSDSWSTADVEATAGGSNAGGLFGIKSGGEANDNWAAGDVTSHNWVGGFVGFSRKPVVSYSRSWASGAVSGGSQSNRRLGFGPFGFSKNSINDNSVYDSVYWNTQTSGIPSTGDFNAGLGVRLQGLASVNFADDDDSWDVGGDNDFPLLKQLDMPWQAVNLTRALTRAHFGSDESATAVTLDTNGEPDGNSSPAEGVRLARSWMARCGR